MRTSLLLLLCAGCSDWSTAVVVTFDGSIAQPGGQYRIDLRRPNGASIKGLVAQTIEFEPGVQEVAVIIENGDELFGDKDSVLARLFVEVLPSADGRPAALGSALVTLVDGDSTELTLPMHADPRPVSGVFSVAFNVSAAGEQQLTVSATPLAAVPNHTLHFWSSDGGAVAWLHAAESLEQPVTITVDVPSGETGLDVLVSAEPGAGTEVLVRSSGWLLASATLDGGVRALIANGAAVDRLLTQTRAALDHAGFAVVAFDEGAGNLASAELHVEHVFNTTVDAVAHEDLDGRGGISRLFGVQEEPFGIDHYRGLIYDGVQAAAERAGNADVFLDVQRCSMRLQQALGDTQSYARAFMASGADADMQLFADAAGRMLGEEFTDFDDPGQTSLCLSNRVAELARFSLRSLDAGE